MQVTKIFNIKVRISPCHILCFKLFLTLHYWEYFYIAPSVNHTLSLTLLLHGTLGELYVVTGVFTSTYLNMTSNANHVKHLYLILNVCKSNRSIVFKLKEYVTVCFLILIAFAFRRRMLCFSLRLDFKQKLECFKWQAAWKDVRWRNTVFVTRN